MGDLGGGPFQIALVQVATTLPVFLLVVPAGALGDILDRRRLLLCGQMLMFCGAGALAVLAATDKVTPVVLLGLIGTMGVGQALCLPSFQAIQPELVGRDEIEQAALLNGANANVGRAVGPALGGAVIATAGPAATFALNAASFLGVLLVLFTWRRPRDHRPLGAEHIRGAIRAGARYIRRDHRFAGVLGRSLLFMTFASALWALLPALARGPLGLGASGYGLLLASLGCGAVLGALAVGRLRSRFGVDFVVTASSIAYAVTMFVVGTGSNVGVAITALLVGGLAWVAVQSILNAAAQVLLPGWIRARALAYYQLVFMGGQALGALGWGALAEAVGLRVAFAVPAIGLLLTSIVASRVLPLPDKELDMRPVRSWPEPDGVLDPEYDAGPVLVTVEWRIVEAKAVEFIEAMRAVGRSRRRTGATLWGLFRDIDDPAVFLETFVVATWHEHLRQHIERGTVADQRLEARAREFLDGGTRPKVRHLIWAAAVLDPLLPTPTR
jgi:MFS family permease